ncbi:hypothetical protein O3G_MSEX001962, partial [Manduca sexta]
MVIALMT